MRGDTQRYVFWPNLYYFASLKTPNLHRALSGWWIHTWSLPISLENLPQIPTTPFRNIQRAPSFPNLHYVSKVAICYFFWKKLHRNHFRFRLKIFNSAVYDISASLVAVRGKFPTITESDRKKCFFLNISKFYQRVGTLASLPSSSFLASQFAHLVCISPGSENGLMFVFRFRSPAPAATSPPQTFGNSDNHKSIGMKGVPGSTACFKITMRCGNAFFQCLRNYNKVYGSFLM